MGRLRRTGCLAALLLSSSLQAQVPLPPSTWRIAEAPPELRGDIARGDLLIVSLHGALQKELSSALAQGGPGFAVNSCHIDVIGVTQRIGRQHGVAAGRTSDRLRNPANAPRPWAAPLVAAYGGQQVREVEGFAVDLGDAVGLLRPIAHRPVCSSCHGTAKSLDPAAYAVVRQRYPSDRAVGFQEGEIRGWFWVEIPKRH